MNNTLQIVIPWAQVIAVLAAMTGGLYALTSFLSLTIYIRTNHPRTHRVFLGVGSGTVTAILSLWVWVNTSTLSVYWSSFVWLGSILELIGLAAIVARDFHVSLRELPK